MTRALPEAGWCKVPLRLSVFGLIWLASGLLILMHSVGFLIDELLFWRYRQVQVRACFIIGVPRSGTTWLQRVMAHDRQFTSFTLWECVFAPSITERYVYSLLAKLLRPLAYFCGSLLKRGLARMDTIHQLRLQEPEEDFLLLAPLHACFLWVLLFPRSERYWRLAFFDQQVDERERKQIMHFYRRCLQKHLFYHGETKILLSKNPSFTPYLDSLRKTFPDARFIACCRDPLEVLPSQLSSLLPALHLLGYAGFDQPLRERVERMLCHYYQQISEKHVTLGMAIVDMKDLCDHLKATVERTYHQLNLSLSDHFAAHLKALAEAGKHYQSRHQYNFDQFNLTKKQVKQTFAEFWPING